MIKGIIFDFNGTLFWDSKLHDKAWNNFAHKISGKDLTAEDLLMHVHGKINKDILTFVLEREINYEEAQKLSEEKEELYRNMLKSNNEKYELAFGAVNLFEHLKEIEIPFTIATSSEKSNVDFYFDYFKLSKWFKYDKVVFENGKMNPKPAPDIFLIASEKIRVDIANCMILEDSFSGIQAARNAGAKKVIFVENDVPVSFDKVKDLVDGKVRNLQDVIAYI